MHSAKEKRYTLGDFLPLTFLSVSHEPNMVDVNNLTKINDLARMALDGSILFTSLVFG